MKKTLYVRPLGLIARCADFLMTPIMYLFSGTVEAPQKTHRWNNVHLKRGDIKHLDSNEMVRCKGKNKALCRINPIFHLPILGGWRDYVVLEPVESIENWHVGWVAGETIGVSRIRLSGPVRLLLGSEDVTFFGVDAKDNFQIPIKKIGCGRIGHGGQYAKVPLL